MRFPESLRFTILETTARVRFERDLRGTGWVQRSAVVCIE